MSSAMNASTQIELISEPSAQLLEQVYALRPRAWRARSPQFPDIETWTDRFDQSSHHWVAMTDGRVVASGRLTIGAQIADLPDPELYAGLQWNGACSVASINRLVVDPDFAGLGLSRLIDEARVTFADEMGVSILLATTFAGPGRLAALEKLGFRRQGYANPYSSGPLSALENLDEGARRQALFMRTAI